VPSTSTCTSPLTALKAAAEFRRDDHRRPWPGPDRSQRPPGRRLPSQGAALNWSVARGDRCRRRWKRTAEIEVLAPRCGIHLWFRGEWRNRKMKQGEASGARTPAQGEPVAAELQQLSPCGHWARIRFTFLPLLWRPGRGCTRAESKASSSDWGIRAQLLQAAVAPGQQRRSVSISRSGYPAPDAADPRNGSPATTAVAAQPAGWRAGAESGGNTTLQHLTAAGASLDALRGPAFDHNFRRPP